MEQITKLSGLPTSSDEGDYVGRSLKAITYTIRVICRVSFKTVKMYENSFVQSVIKSYRQGWAVNLFPQTLVF